jgi:hypothetical protein
VAETAIKDDPMDYRVLDMDQRRPEDFGPSEVVMTCVNPPISKDVIVMSSAKIKDMEDVIIVYELHV